MTTQAKAVFKAALELPKKNRAALAEKLLESLDDDQDIVAAGAREAERRWRAYVSGKTTAKPIEEVIRSLLENKKKS